MTFELLRGEAPKANRPQTPKPPYPYLEEEVTFENGDVTLAGTLTIPKGEGPFPAVALVTGSGPQDRNEEIFEHKPFMVLADHLSRAGIAVLRYDDRGTGESGGTFGTSTSETFMTDALAAVSFLAEQERIDKQRVGIAGHSEGGLIAPMAAARSKDVAFIVIMAGPGVPGKEILVRQVGLLSKAAGVDDETAASIQSAQQRALDLITEGADTETVRAQIKKLVETQMGAETAGLEQTVDRSMLELTSPWFRYFLGYDPRHDLEKLKKIPVLALNGEKDLQVDPKQNLPEIEKALKKAENKDVTIVELPSLNHLFQTADSGAVSEYYTIEETMSPKALDLIRDWIAERFQ
jgi:alpha-beta hydrolase superfamily lysophospholipase